MPEETKKGRNLSTSSLGWASRTLLLIIILSNGYVIMMPFIPKIEYEYRQSISKPVVVDMQNLMLDRTTNHLVVPSLQLDEPILDSTNPATIHEGIWRRPNTNTPDMGGNTVVVGHRFDYKGGGVFYNLDKLKLDDDIYAVYGGKIYHYQVETSKIVPPTAVEVESQTNESILTLYTCTPIWTARDRLVFTAKLIGEL